MASRLIQEVTTHAQSDSLEDAREICADGTYSPNKLRTYSDAKIDVIINLQLDSYNRHVQTAYIYGGPCCDTHYFITEFRLAVLWD